MGQQFGKYEILVRLAAGGMAELFLARQRGIMGFERFVVIKKILPHLSQDKEFVLMFLDEARIAAQLNHPNVIQVHDLGEQDDEYYIAMEYLEGQSLSVLLHQAGELKLSVSPSVVSSIVVQVCEGLHYAHGLTTPEGEKINLVHRDISPQNIFVTYSGVVKVVDFGVALVEQKLVKTSTGTIKGKYPYMSPEQVEGRTIDQRSDLFSLGVVFWEALTGRRLFKLDNELAIIRAITARHVIPPSQIQSEVPGLLDQVTLKALRKDRRKRYASAKDFQQDLLQATAEAGYTSGPPVVADCMQGIFKDIIAEQKEMLKQAERGEVSLQSPGALKPETDESLYFTAQATARSTRSRLGLVMLAVVLVLSGMLVWYLATKESETPGDQTRPPGEKTRPPVASAARPVAGTAPTPILANRVLPPDAAPGRKPRRPWLGVSIRRVNSSLAKSKNLPQSKGALVARVLDNSPAERAGLKQGDRIISIAGKPVADLQALIKVVRGSQLGKQVEIRIIRKGEQKTLPIVPEAKPPPKKHGWLQVAISPSGARVNLNGKPWKPEPEGGARLRSGTHTLTVAKSGFLSETRTVRIAAGATIQLDIQLKPEPANPE